MNGELCGWHRKNGRREANITQTKPSHPWRREYEKKTVVKTG